MRKKYYAFAEHSTIQAVIHKLFRFKNEPQMLAMMARIREEFILSQKIDGASDDAPVLWIRGFDISKKEREKGYLGHYAQLKARELDKGRWTLIFKKIDLPLRKHPERRVVDRRHPNWGHPVLKKARKAKAFSSMEEADALLAALHEEFPDVSIPGLHRLRILVYRKPENGNSAIQKLELFIRKQEDGGYVIDYRAQAEKQPDKESKPQILTRKQALQGHFTAMVNKRRKKNK